jgi:hypothetical protein
MLTITKRLGILGLALMLSICVNTTVNAQSPADDPGIGGPGSPGNGPSGDGSPIVPFDGGMSLMLAISGITYASKKMKGVNCKVSL